MNWPQLTNECSQAVEEAIRDAVKQKPTDLLEHVARLLSERSGLDPEQFEAHFEDCQRQPKLYTLEDRCPPGQDPLAWVPMRYNDDTIMLSLERQAMEIEMAILAEDVVFDDSLAMGNAVVAAFPELTYLRSAAGVSEDDAYIEALQAMRAIALVFSGDADEAVAARLQAVEPQLCFSCAALFKSVRAASSVEIVKQGGAATLDALVVSCFLRIVASRGGFAQKYGDGCEDAAQAVLHAIEHEPAVLPSYQRLSASSKRLVVAILQAYVPLHMVISCEVAPAHFAKANTVLAGIEGSLDFFVAFLLVDHLALCQSVAVADQTVEVVKLTTQLLVALEKATPAKVYELMLKKRAERHSWRLGKDELVHAIVRVCCFLNVEQTEAWTQIQAAFETLSEEESEVLKIELGYKDGITECPAFVPVGVHKVMSRGADQAANLRFLAAVFSEAAKNHSRSFTHKVVNLQFGEVAELIASGVPFDGVPIELAESPSGDLIVRLKH